MPCRFGTPRSCRNVYRGRLSSISNRRAYSRAHMTDDVRLRRLSLFQTDAKATNVDGDVLRRAVELRVPVLQWGRRRTSTETELVEQLLRPCLAASMGPSTNVDGDCRCRSGRTPRYRRLQWGRRRTSTATPLDRASMSIGDNRFNGAVDERRRRQAIPAVRKAVERGLQWGRRRTSTETKRLDELAQHYQQLQWGRRRTSTETTGARGPCGQPRPLQWGGRRTSTETAKASRNPRTVGALQWGRRRTSTETELGERRGDCHLGASMGPSPNGDGDSSR